jgi:hypothetical protein
MTESTFRHAARCSFMIQHSERRVWARLLVGPTVGKRGNVMHERNLSSAWTFWTKFVFPAVWISGFGTGTILLWLGRFHGRNNALPPPQEKFLFLAMWILGSTFILWASAGLKRVRIDERQLYVSNYVKEIHIPFARS